MWGQHDITWCSSECDNLLCFRNKIKIIDKTGIYSFADFKAAGECPVEAVENDEERMCNN